MTETQATIEAWRAETFGGRPTPVNMTVRANEEMAGLIRAVTNPVTGCKEIAAEAADVLIMLYGVAEMAGFSLHRAVNDKMAINRARRWRKGAPGRSQHIPDDEGPPA